MRIFIWLLLASVLSACVSVPASIVSRPRPTPSIPEDAVTFRHRIDDEAMWHTLATRQEGDVFAHTEEAKFLIDLEDKRKVYFPNTHLFEIHYDFARRMLNTSAHPVESHAAFNVREYRREDRRFVLGSIVHYLDGDLWTFELIAGDTLDGPRIVEAFRQIQETVFFGAQLRFVALSDVHERSIDPVRAQLPVLPRNELFSHVVYQPVTPGVAFGHLRIVRGELDVASVSPTDIVVLQNVPEDLPVCAALVTSQLQAPLAHVAVLSRNRGTPNMSLRNAADDPAFAALDGQLVRLQVSPQEYSLEATTHALAEAHWRQTRPMPLSLAQPNDSVQQLREVCSLDLGDTPFAGAKASQLGGVCDALSDDMTPGGFVIPMHFYLSHLRASGIDVQIAQMISSPQFMADRAFRAESVTAIRRAIEAAPIDARLLAMLRARMQPYAGQRTIFRSSTNAEDLPGFNGAGLYESVSLRAQYNDDDLSRVVRRVWSSVWTLRGVEERQWYGIDHLRVAMAVLVQPFVEPTIGGGVAITANPFYEGRPAVFINIQSGGSVTDARGDDIPEQYLVYTYNESPELEQLSRSSRSPGRNLLTPQDVLALTDALQTLHSYMLPSFPSAVNAVDVEFFVRTDHRVVIVQARPFRVNYTEGQRYPLQ